MYYAVRKKTASRTNEMQLIGLTGKVNKSGTLGVTASIDGMKAWPTAAELYRELRTEPDAKYFRAADLYNEPTDGFKPLWWYHG